MHLGFYTYLYPSSEKKIKPGRVLKKCYKIKKNSSFIISIGFLNFCALRYSILNSRAIYYILINCK